jgi:arylsulfatase A
MQKTIAVLLVGSVFFSAAAEARAQARKMKPNIVFILADDLGVYDLGCYGRKEHHTPNLDKLARQGTRFTSAYCAQPICSPTRAAIMTGKAPARLHLTTFLPGRPNTAAQMLLHPDIHQQLPLDELTLAEYLRDLGYTSAMIGKWHLGGAGFGPKEQGFDVVSMPKPGTVPGETEGGRAEYDLTNQAIKFIEANKDRPFFVYLAHYTPHIPLSAKSELVQKHKGAFNPTYAAMMETLDDCVGRLLRKLDDLGLGDNTIVVFTSDNGGLHVLEGGLTPATHNGRFRAGKGFLYEGGLRIPLIVRWPGRVPADRTDDTPVISTDWLPTFLELAAAPPAKASFDGVSLAALLQGGALAPRSLYWHFPHYTNQGSRPAGAVRDGNWVLIEHYEDGKLELFDLSNDISQTRNVANIARERAARMKGKLAQWRKDVSAQENRPNPKFDASLHKELYLDIDVSSLRIASTAADTARQMTAWRASMNSVLPRKK